MDKGQKPKTPLDIAADLLVYAPLGIALELGKQLPDLAQRGRDAFQGPVDTAKVFGKMAADQGRREFGDKLRKAAEPYFGSGPGEHADHGTANTSNERKTETTVHTEQPRQGAANADVHLPIAGYDTLPAAQIVSHLSSLTTDEVAAVAAYESSVRARAAILDACKAILDTPA